VLEAQAFEHEQKLLYYTKAKQVLDEWVRYETAVREREQKRIAEEVIAGVMESVKDSRFVSFPDDNYFIMISGVNSKIAIWINVCRMWNLRWPLQSNVKIEIRQLPKIQNKHALNHLNLTLVMDDFLSPIGIAKKILSSRLWNRQ
jgi:hypothetical protein